MKDKSFLKGRLIAHRGVYDNKSVYENTLKAFDKAIKLNYIIELDVRMLNDGTLIVFHDEDMQRLLHLEGNIEKISYEELSYLAKYPIPTLEETLNLVNGSVPLIIELKNIKKRGVVESKVMELLDNYKGKYAIQSFHIRTIKWFVKNRSNVVVGYLIGRKNASKIHLFKKFDFININMGLVNDKKLKLLKANYLVLGYTIRTRKELEIKKNYYDNLICDNLLEIDSA